VDRIRVQRHIHDVEGRERILYVYVYIRASIYVHIEIYI
jgi:hypothetical protein